MVVCTSFVYHSKGHTFRGALSYEPPACWAQSPIHPEAAEGLEGLEALAAGGLPWQVPPPVG